jgi:hypothetical protein
MKKDKQLGERKLCSHFAKPQKQIEGVYFSSVTYCLRHDFFERGRPLRPPFFLHTDFFYLKQQSLDFKMALIGTSN